MAQELYMDDHFDSVRDAARVICGRIPGQRCSGMGYGGSVQVGGRRRCGIRSLRRDRHRVAVRRSVPCFIDGVDIERIGCGRREGSPGEAGLVGDLVHGRGHEVDPVRKVPRVIGGRIPGQRDTVFCCRRDVQVGGRRRWGAVLRRQSWRWAEK